MPAGVMGFSVLALAAIGAGVGTVLWGATYWPVVVLAALAVLGLPLSRARGAPWMWRDSPAQRTVICLGLVMIVAIGIAIAFRSAPLQVFALSSLSKRLTLPLVYGAFAFSILKAYRDPSPRSSAVSMPVWWWWLAALVVISTASAVVAPRQDSSLYNVAQGVALPAGLLLLSCAGFQAGRWTASDERRMLLVLLGGGALSGVLGRGLPPFMSLLVPAAFSAVYLSVAQSERHWPLSLAAIVLPAALVFDVATNPEATRLSIAVLGQIAVCLFLLLLFALPRILQVSAMILGLAASCLVVTRMGVIDLLLGRFQGYSDVTLSHRGYEAAVVIESVTESPLSFLLGLGPGATVNLNMSPDARTLESSGRVLMAVDDVHFLTSFVLLKFGVLGLAWVITFATVIAVECVKLCRDRRATPWDRAMVLFLACGLVAALPAATHLFSNPLVAVLLAVLVARRKYRSAIAGDSRGAVNSLAVSV